MSESGPRSSAAEPRRGLRGQAWTWVVVAVGVFGLLLRALNAHANLSTPSIDENDVVDQAVAFMGGEWRYYLLEYGPLPMYLLAAIYRVAAWLHGSTALEYASQVFFDLEEQYYIARLFCAATYALLAIAAVRVLAPRFGRWAAGVSGLLLALPCLDTLTASTVRIDIQQGAFQVGALLCLTVALESRQYRHWLLAGVCAGLGIACKPMPGLLVLPCFLAASWMCAESDAAQRAAHVPSSPSAPQRDFGVAIRGCLWRVFETLRRPALWLSGLAALLAAALGNPTSLDLRHFIKAQRQALQFYSGSTAPGGHLDAFRAFGPLEYGFLGVAALSVLAMPFVRDARARLIALFPLIYVTAFWGRPVRHYYLVAPAMALCLVIGIAIGLLLERLEASWGNARAEAFRLLAPALSLALVAGIASSPLRELNDGRRQPTSNARARDWIYAHIPSGTKIFHFGSFVRGPRIVGMSARQQQEFGDYFEYGRDKYVFLRQAFQLAYDEYTAQQRPWYRLEVTRLDPSPAGTKTLPRWAQRSLDRHAREKGEEYIILAGFRGPENPLELGYAWLKRVELVQQFHWIAIFRVPQVPADLDSNEARTLTPETSDKPAPETSTPEASTTQGDSNEEP